MNPFKEEEATPAMKLGTAFHALILEPDTFLERFIILPPANDLKKDSKEWDELQELYKNTYDINDFKMPQGRATRIVYEGSKEIIRIDDFNQLKIMAVMLFNNRIMKKVFSDGIAEVSVFWQDKDTGLMCRARFDYLTANYIADLKTTTDTTLYSLTNSIANFGYDVSASYYLEGLRNARELIKDGKVSGSHDKGEEWMNKLCESKKENFILAFQNKKAPYDNCAKHLTEDIINLGNAKIREGINIYVDNFNKYGIEIWKDGNDKIEQLSIDDLPQKVYY